MAVLSIFRNVHAGNICLYHWEVPCCFHFVLILYCSYNSDFLSYMILPWTFPHKGSSHYYFSSSTFSSAFFHWLLFKSMPGNLETISNNIFGNASCVCVFFCCCCYFFLALSKCGCSQSEPSSSICPLAASEGKTGVNFGNYWAEAGKFYLAIFNEAVCAPWRVAELKGMVCAVDEFSRGPAEMISLADSKNKTRESWCSIQ